MKRRFAFMCMFALAMSAMGCGPTNPPAQTPGIVGTITSFQLATDNNRVATMMVEGGEQEPGAVSDKAYVTITEETTVLDIGGNRISPAGLAKGLAVQVWFKGPVAESYPVQGTASFVKQMP